MGLFFSLESGCECWVVPGSALVPACVSFCLAARDSACDAGAWSCAADLDLVLVSLSGLCPLSWGAVAALVAPFGLFVSRLPLGSPPSLCDSLPLPW